MANKLNGGARAMINHRKKLYILLSIVIALIIISGFKEDEYVPPDGFIWNEELQEYYNSEILTWDLELHQYNLVEPPISRTSQIINEVVFTDYDAWMNDHRNSDSPVEKLIVKYIDTIDEYVENERKRYDASEGHEEVLMMQSDVIRNEDVLKEMGRLDLKYLPELLSYVNADRPLSTEIPFAIMYMMKSCIVSCGFANEPEFFDYNLWHEDFKKRFIEAETAVNQLDDQSQMSKSGTDIESIISEYGAFALPAICDQINSGNTTLIPCFKSALPLCYESENANGQGMSDIKAFEKDVLLLKSMYQNE